MQNSPTKSIQIHVTPDDFESAQAFIEGLLERNDISRNISSQTMLVLFLSLGTPNQPGSILIGILIILLYLDSFELLSLAICMEVFFGGIQNIINVIGNIVLAAIEDHASR